MLDIESQLAADIVYVVTIDDDGIMKKSTELEEVGTAFFGPVVELGQGFFQPSNGIWQPWRSQKGIQILEKRSMDEMGVMAVQTIYEEMTQIYEQTGKKGIIASLSERPEGALDLLKARYDEAGILDNFSKFWLNPFEDDHTQLKPWVASELRRLGIYQIHLDNKFSVGKRISREGSVGLVRASFANRVLYDVFHPAGVILVHREDYGEAIVAAMQKIPLISSSSVNAFERGKLLLPTQLRQREVIY